jgi:large subunit ribosomal protein L15
MKDEKNAQNLDLGSLSPAPGSRSKERRLGRGTSAGQGRTCGKGHKGQKARAGYNYKPGFEGGQMPIQRRLPKRGFSNSPFRKVYQIVNLKQLNEAFSAGQEVNPETLLKQGLISKAHLPVKVLGDGDIKVALKMQVHAASQSAVEKIKAAGGEVQLL